MDDYPANHQELFDAYYAAEWKIQGEWGGDWQEFERWAKAYAAQNGLSYGDEG